MKMKRSLRKLLSTVGTLAAAALVAYLQYREDEAGTPLPPARESSAQTRGENGYTLLDGCSLIKNRGNDGDSFLLRTPDGEQLHLRLYFADAPEKYRHQYNGDRIREQGEDFGGLGEDATIAAGQEAKKRALGLLASSEFQVATAWEKVFDSGRYYGFVRFRTGPENGRYLTEVLVREGLARIHTKGNRLPDGRRASAFKSHLQGLASQARAAKRGAWGL